MDLEAEFKAVSEDVRHATKTASESLTKAGIRHALVGGLAVGAYARPRATLDVDFLVGNDAFVQHPGGIVTHRPDVPVQVGGIAIDLLSEPGESGSVQHALSNSTISAGVPVAPVESLVLLKLRSPRIQDSADVVAIIKSGADVNLLRRHLQTFEPALIGRLDDLAHRAENEPN